MRDKISIDLIIQGPIISKGREGKYYDEQHIVEYNCIDNINDILKQYSHLFSNIILATWQNENIEGIEKYDNFKIIQLEELNIEGSGSSKNKYRQFYSCYEGAKKLKEYSKSDYLIKIRTDQFLDLEIFYDFVKSIEIKKDNIFISQVIKYQQTLNSKYDIADYYFFGKFDTLYKFFHNMIAFNFFEFNISVHKEIYFKHLYFYKDILNIKDFYFFPKLNYYLKGYSKLEKYAFENIFLPLNKELFQSVIWRGGKLDNEKFVNNGWYFEDWNNDVKKDFFYNGREIEISLLNFCAFVDFKFLNFKYKIKENKLNSFLYKVASKINFEFLKIMNKYQGVEKW